MAGAGTDKTKRWVEQPGPVVVLVEPQLGDNIGAVARAMANFGLGQLRIVKPLQGWPNARAKVMAAGADRVLDNAVIYDSFDAAIADCTCVLATTARNHDQAKPVVSAEAAAAMLAPKVAGGERVALVFGRERNGLENHEVGRADAIVTLPVNPAFASLNLAQAVLICAYEWFKLAGGGTLPFASTSRSPSAAKQQMAAFFEDLERELDAAEFFRPSEKRGTMRINLMNIFNRMQPTEQDMRTLHGIVTALVQGRKGPARGGTLNPSQSELLRTLLSERGGPAGREGGPAKGLSKLLRRNPTEAERALWEALSSDRRFAGLGFKRQTPVGPHIADFVSFRERCVIELLPADEQPDAALARADKQAWFEAHDYKVITVSAAVAERDPVAVLDRLADIVT